MRKLYSTLILFFSAITTMAQGWPENYKGIMLQGFYWDGYADSKWTVLEKQADELSQYFDLIWVPQSGMTSKFYHNTSASSGFHRVAKPRSIPTASVRPWATTLVFG